MTKTRYTRVTPGVRVFGSDRSARRRPRRRSDRVDDLGQRRLLVRRLVAVDDPGAHGLVELSVGRHEEGTGRLPVPGLGGRADLTDGGAQRGLGGLVAETVALVGAVPLDLGLDVGHSSKPLVVSRGVGTPCQAAPTRVRSTRCFRPALRGRRAPDTDCSGYQWAFARTKPGRSRWGSDTMVTVPVETASSSPDARSGVFA